MQNTCGSGGDQKMQAHAPQGCNTPHLPHVGRGGNTLAQQMRCWMKRRHTAPAAPATGSAAQRRAAASARLRSTAEPIARDK